MMKYILLSLLLIGTLVVSSISAAEAAAAAAAAHPKSTRLASAFNSLEEARTKSEHHMKLITRTNRRKIGWIAQRSKMNNAY